MEAIAHPSYTFAFHISIMWLSEGKGVHQGSKFRNLTT